MNETPQQTSAVNCTVFSLAWAIEEALRKAGPQYVQTVDRVVLERHTGAPVMPSIAAERSLTYPNCFWVVWASEKSLQNFPVVVAYSGDGFSHTVGVRSATEDSVEVYDPAYGTYRWIEKNKFNLYSGDWVHITVLYPRVTKPWLKYKIVQWLFKLFGLL